MPCLPASTWVSQHALSINGKRQGIDRNDLLNVARSMNIKKAESILNEVDESVKRWREFAEEQSVRADLRDAISSTLVDLG